MYFICSHISCIIDFNETLWKSVFVFCLFCILSRFCWATSSRGKLQYLIVNIRYSKKNSFTTFTLCVQDGDGNETWAGKTCKCECDKDSSGKLLSKGSGSSWEQGMVCMPGKKEKILFTLQCLSIDYWNVSCSKNLYPEKVIIMTSKIEHLCTTKKKNKIVVLSSALTHFQKWDGLVSTSRCPLETDGRACANELAPGQARACSRAESH